MGMALDFTLGFWNLKGFNKLDRHYSGKSGDQWHGTGAIEVLLFHSNLMSVRTARTRCIWTLPSNTICDIPELLVITFTYVFFHRSQYFTWHHVLRI